MSRPSRRFEPPAGLPPLRRSLNTAIAWRIAAELIRRHQARFGLRVLETHPGGGQYDCLSLTMPANGMAHAVHLAAFNLGSGRVTIFHPIGTDGSAEHWRDDYYAEYAIRQQEPCAVIDRIEALAGLPRIRKLPPVDTAVRCVRILAAVMEAEALAREPRRAECGWYDSSGTGGSSVQAWLTSAFPRIASDARREPDWQGQARVAARAWKIGDAVLDIASGSAVRLAQPDRVTLLLHADERTAADWLIQS